MSVRRLSLMAAMLVGGACVSTQQVDPDRSPDPRDDLPELDAAARAAVGATEHARAAAERPLGTVVDVIEGDPIVNVRLVLQSGSADDPAGKEGLAALSAKLARQATERLSVTELTDTLYPWAAELDVQVDKDTIAFIGRVHRDHAAAFTEVFLDVLLHPRLDAKDFARVKSEQRTFVTTTLRMGNDEALQREALEALLYDGRAIAPSAFPAAVRHPYAHTPAGTVAGLDAITLDDVGAFLARARARDRLVLGISGGAPAAMVSRLTGALEALPFSDQERTAAPTPAAPNQNLLVIVDKPAAGTAISVGFALTDLSRAHPDYPAMKLAETWFGEHRNLIGHLFSSMREKRGLNYGDYAYVEHFAQEGWSTYEQLNIPRRTQYFSMWIRPVEHKNRLFALRQTLWELDRFAREGIPDDESFARVQSFVQGYWQQKEQTPLRRLGYQVDQALTRQPFDRDGLRERVRKLTRADVNAAIRRHLRADRLSVVVVTDNGAALAADIAADKHAPLIYLAPPTDPAQLADDGRIDAFSLGLAGDHVLVVKPDALFAR